MRSAMHAILTVVAFATVCPAPVDAVRQYADVQVLANPIRKVVTMLQTMQQKVTEEGEREKTLYSDFMCYCQKNGGVLDTSIAAAEAKVPTVSSDIAEAEAKLLQIKEDLKGAQEDRNMVNSAMAEATALREKEAREFSKDKACHEENIDAINKAVSAIEKGMAGGFLQTAAARVLRQFVMKKQDTLGIDVQDLLAFLSAKEGSEYVPKSGQVVGILKQLGDEMAQGLAEATSVESAAIHTYQGLMAAKSQEKMALTAKVESKMKKAGDLGVEIAEMKADLSDTEAALLEDKECLANLKKSCATKSEEWEQRSKIRTEELAALAETIKLLNDDDALELFKKTVPSSSASFVQMKAGTSAIRARALAEIRTARRTAGLQEQANLDLLVLALSEKEALDPESFAKVIEMIDRMVGNLKKEQQDDDQKKGFCANQFDLSDDKKKALEHAVADEEQAIVTAKEGIDTLVDELKALKAGVMAMDKSVTDATEQRTAENAEFKELMATNAAAKELIGLAKNRLMKFYVPKLWKAPEKAELTSQDRIVASLDGPVMAQVSEQRHHGAATPAPPATWGPYAAKSEETAGVVEMLGLILKVLERQMAEAETGENGAQADYELMMRDAAAKRAADSKSIGDKEAAKAELEEALTESKEAKASATKELMAMQQYIASLHASCDWLLQYFDVRKEARASEIDALKRAKAVLKGASYSLVQTAVWDLNH